MRPPGHGPQQDDWSHAGSNTHWAHREPGPVTGVQSASFWQIGMPPLQAPTFEQKHSTGIPTHAQPVIQGAPNWHAGQPGAQTPPYPWANAGVLMLVRIGADQATTAPVPIRFSSLRREIPFSEASMCESPVSTATLPTRRVTL
jgi:hypothetical protein